MSPFDNAGETLSWLALRGVLMLLCLGVIFGQSYFFIVEDQGQCLYWHQLNISQRKGLSGMWVNMTRQLQQQ